MSKVESNLLNNFNATFCVHIQNFGYGSAVAVDYVNGSLILATAAHVALPNATKITVIDHRNLKYNVSQIITRDNTYDFALIRVDNFPEQYVALTSLPVDRRPVNIGTECYAIGWAESFDMNSVSMGCVRSPIWALFGCVSQTLVDVSVLPGNSGCGVFNKHTHQLIGITSWGLEGLETLNGLIPGYCITESLKMIRRNYNILYTTFNKNDYFLGVSMMLLSANETTSYAPQYRNISKHGKFGAWIDYIMPNSPLSRLNVTLNLIWAIAHDNVPQDKLDWKLVTEDNPIDAILYDIYTGVWFQNTSSNHKMKKAVANGQIKMIDNDPFLPETLPIAILASYVSNGNLQLAIARVRLPKRYQFLATYQPDLSEDMFVYAAGRKLLKHDRIRPTSIDHIQNSHNGRTFLDIAKDIKKQSII